MNTIGDYVKYIVNMYVKHTFKIDTRDNYVQSRFSYSEHFSSEYMYSKLNFTCPNNTITFIVSLSSHIILCINMLSSTNAAYIAAMQCVCCSFFILSSEQKLSGFVIVRISTGTVHATNLVAYFYNRSWFNRCELGTGLVLEHQTCSNLSSRESLHREWRHMLPSTPPAKFHQGMLPCLHICLPH